MEVTMDEHVNRIVLQIYAEIEGEDLNYYCDLDERINTIWSLIEGFREFGYTYDAFYKLKMCLIREMLKLNNMIRVHDSIEFQGRNAEFREGRKLLCRCR